MADKKIIMVIVIIGLVIFMGGNQKQSAALPEENPCDKFSCEQEIDSRGSPVPYIPPPLDVPVRGGER